MSAKRDFNEDEEQEEDQIFPALVITGNPIDGFSYHGPFRNSEEANDWADDELRGEEWWVAHMTPQTKRRKTFRGLKVQIQGGVLQDCDVHLPCAECGALVVCDEGYVLEDQDVDDKHEEK